MKTIKVNSIVLDFNRRFARVLRVYKHSQKALIAYPDGGEQTTIALADLELASDESLSNLKQLIATGLINEI